MTDEQTEACKRWNEIKKLCDNLDEIVGKEAVKRLETIALQNIVSSCDK